MAPSTVPPVRLLAPAVRCHNAPHALPTGRRITPGFGLPAKLVVHTVGPVWRGGDEGEPELLASCYRESLRLAQENSVRSIAFPAISCGVYGYPIQQAVSIALTEVNEWLATDPLPERVIFCCFGNSMAQAYRLLLDT